MVAYIHARLLAMLCDGLVSCVLAPCVLTPNFASYLTILRLSMQYCVTAYIIAQ